MTRLACLAHVALAAALVLLASCADGNSGVPQCEDGFDNDRDGYVDGADPACASGQTSESQDPPAPCEDGLDNDGDGHTDFPADPGCSSTEDQDEFSIEPPDCMNGLDDDSDGKTDFPNDPGCRAANQMNEADDCPSGPLCPQCGNGVDDDFDTRLDFPGDPGCTSASATFEYNLDPDACGSGTTVAELPASGVVSGTIGSGAGNIQAATCSGGAVGTGAEAAFSFLVEEPTVLVATTNLSSTTIDTVLYVRRACMTGSTELVCSDDINPSNNKSAITVALQPGAYFLIVDAKTAQAGGFALQTTFYRGLGQTCSGPAQCAPGFDCRMPAGGSGTSCERPVCSDGRDDDGDTKIDFPNDPGCTAPDDGTEADMCPAGASCPDCADGVDNDLDGNIDYPLDTSCASASGAAEYSCTTVDPVRTFSTNLTAQAASSLANDIDVSCGSPDGRDEVFALIITRPLSELYIDTVGSTIDTAITLKRGSCSSFELQCDDNSALNGDSRIFLIDVLPGEYYLVVDDKNTTGTYNLNVRGVIANGASCDPASTAFTCALGYACTGAAGLETCTPAQCNDAVDDDGDGDGTGYPNDPGCTSPSDATEDDACPSGPGCPLCSNDLDDDGDTFIDYGVDPGCVAASSNSELAPCTSADPVLVLTNPTIVNAATTGRTNDLDLSCGTDGRDEVYRLNVSRPLATLTVDTVGSALDTVLAIRGATCNGTTDLACDDNTAGNGDSRVTLTNVGVGEYFIVVDDRTNSDLTYNLNVSATIAPGGACDPASTVFTCTQGHVCAGAPTTTCMLAACNNNLDDDGDNDGVGFPVDPGCASTSDNSEDDDCPSGPGCPACSNDLDDDMDGLTDYPMDPGCSAAGINSELAPCTSMDTVPIFTTNVVNATTMNRFNDLDLSCGADGRDMIYRYYVTQPMVSLTVDTFGSDTNTAVALRRGTCNGTTDLACGTNNFGTSDARATLTPVPAGEYFIVVDDLGTTTPTTFNLNVSGVLAGGARCTPASTAFVCEGGYTCAGAAGAETCAPTACNDTIDQDGNGDGTSYPVDPGCTSVSDLDEADDCPSGPNCPDCADDIDNDMDGLIDFPADTGCISASSLLEVGCAAETDPVLMLSTPVHNGTTAGASNSLVPSCSSFSTAPERVYVITLPVPVAVLTVDTVGTSFDTVLSVADATCGMTLGCNDDAVGLQSRVVVNALAAGSYSVIVDGYSTNSGAYTLNTRGTVVNGTACTHPLFTAGVLACTAPATCTAGTCQ